MTATPPLYVDLDGTLIPGDSLWETLLAGFRSHPSTTLWCLLRTVFFANPFSQRGKARFKALIAAKLPLPDIQTLTVNQEFLHVLEEEKRQGRPIFLATAAHMTVANHIAAELDIFDAVISTSDDQNLKGRRKLLEIVKHAKLLTGSDKFAYAGNHASDLPIWSCADEVFVVNAPKSLLNEVIECNSKKSVQFFNIKPEPLISAVRLIRAHQWSKNLLLFVPLLASHTTELEPWLSGFSAFGAFGLIASATYIFNDLADLDSDRLHPRKRYRPLASGAISIPIAVFIAIIFSAIGTFIGLGISQSFFTLLAIYTGCTLLYSTVLKRYVFIDVLTLAMLYTLRIFAGAIATGVIISNWLLMLSIFLFLSLALIKRCAELEDLLKSGSLISFGRGYSTQDLTYLRPMGIASAFIATLVMALYIDRPQVLALYHHPQLLWFIVPLLLTWCMRLWFETAKGRMHDDPLVFALKDPLSWGFALSTLAIGIAASLP